MYPHEVGKRKISLRKIVLVWAVFVLCCLMSLVSCVVGFVVMPARFWAMIMAVSIAVGVWVGLLGGCLLCLWCLLFVWRNRRWLC